MNVGAFLVVILVAEATGSESILDYRGLSRRHLVAAVAFAIFLFSLTGLPPLRGSSASGTCSMRCSSGSMGRAAAGTAWLLLIGALNTAVSLYYYVRVVRAMFIDQPYTADAPPITSRPVYQLLLGGFSVAILVFGAVVDADGPLDGGVVAAVPRVQLDPLSRASRPGPVHPVGPRSFRVVRAAGAPAGRGRLMRVRGAAPRAARAPASLIVTSPKWRPARPGPW